jgi:hypothetical protein
MADHGRFGLQQVHPGANFTNSVAGVLGGLLGWLILRALRRAGFFAYLAEKR